MIGTIGFGSEGALILLIMYISCRNHDRFASFSELLDKVLATRAARITVLTFWWWLGWHFFFAQTVDPTH